MLNVCNIVFGYFLSHFLSIYNNQQNILVVFIAFERKTPLTSIFFLSYKNFVKTSLALSKESKTINKLLSSSWKLRTFPFLKSMAGGWLA
jgi:ABC-type arginine/histidine transport system permease subunit